MKMNEFMTALQTHLATQQPNYPDNAESILSIMSKSMKTALDMALDDLLKDWK